MGYTSGQLRAQEDEGAFKVDKFALGGFCGGLIANLLLPSFLSLQSELLYFHKGKRYNVLVPIDLPGVTIKVRETRSLSYLEIPVLLKLSIAVSRPLRLTLLTGPSMGINLTVSLIAQWILMSRVCRSP